MTVTHRKRQTQPEEIQTVNEPGLQIQCDGCDCDLTHSVRLKCADPVCEDGDDVDICPACFCAGKEFAKHKKNHAYRVVELHSYPIFEEDWGADEELLLLEGISLQGLGNWQAIAEHVGTRSKEEVESHYNKVYIDSPNWPLPQMDLEFTIDPSLFLAHKRRRLANLHKSAPPPPPKIPPTSAPGTHEVASFLPGRLEFEHEMDNDAEDLVKDLEFGMVHEWGGDEIMEDEADGDVKARARMKDEARAAREGGKRPNGLMNGMNGYHYSTPIPPPPPPKSEDKSSAGGGAEEEEDPEEPTLPPPIETQSSLAFKLTLLETYLQRVDKRVENKVFMFNRGLLSYKQMQAAEKKRPREEKEVMQRLRPFARLMTAEDWEAFVADTLWESMLRKRIQELQVYRRLGLVNAADIEKYDIDVAKRQQVKASLPRDYHVGDRYSARPNGRGSLGPDSERGSTPGAGSSHNLGSVTDRGPSGRKMPAPLNLANSPSLHLLTPEEQTLCSTLRILPKPYLVIKETLIREYARRGGKLRRREARDLVKIDVNKTSRVWDFLVQAGFMSLGNVGVGAAATGSTGAGVSDGAVGQETRVAATPTLSASPSKDSLYQAHTSPKPPFVPNSAFSFTPPSSFGNPPGRSS